MAKVNPIVIDRSDVSRKVGAGALGEIVARGPIGASGDGFNMTCEMIKKGWNTQPHYMPVIHDVQGSFDGPISEADTQKVFGSQIRPLNWDENTPGPLTVQTTLWNGEPQADFIVQAIGVHFETSPTAFTAQGAAWTKPTVATAAPVVPDVWTQSDLTNGSFGITGGTTPVVPEIIPAVMRYGSAWQALMFYHFSRAFAFYWQVANNVSIANNLLRTVAYTPPLGQMGSSGLSEADVLSSIAQMNDQYADHGAAQIFLKQNAIRLGSLGANLPAGGVAPMGDFSPTRAGQLVGVTYGGGDLGAALLRDLRSNGEYVKLSNPYVIKAGLATGVMFRQVDETQATAFRNAMSITNGTDGQGAGVVPPYETDYADVSTGFNAGAYERCIDDATATYLQKTYSQQYIFKGGTFKISVKLLGQELSPDEYAGLCTDPVTRAALTGATGLKFANHMR